MASLLEGPQTGAAMSSRQVFQAQLASIMEVLANAAVAEICKLVDNDYAVLNLQMSQCQHENKDLKRRLHELELKVAREQAEKRLSVVNSNVNNNNNNKTISSTCGSPPPVNVHCVSAGAAHMTQVDMGLWQSSEASEDSDVEATHSRAPHCDAHEEQPQEPGAATLKEEITQEGGEDDTDMEVALGLLKQEEDVSSPISCPRLVEKPSEKPPETRRGSQPPRDLGTVLPDLPLRCISLEKEGKLFRASKSTDQKPQAGRYACLLFRNLVPLSVYQTWVGAVNYSGNRQKNALPKNLRDQLESMVSRKFPRLDPKVRKKEICDRINELLRTRRLFFPLTE